MVTIVPPPSDAQGDDAHRPECGCPAPYADCPHPPCDCWVCTEEGPDALDSPPIAALLHQRLASWFGDDRQAFLVSDLVPVVSQIVAEFQHNALEMARKADLAERRAEEAEYHVEQLRDARDAAERRLERAEAETERLRDALLQVRRAFDLQCPPMPADKYADRGAWMAHSWWNTVLGSILNRAGAADIQSNNECSTGLCGEHHWLDRPESDTRECMVCGAEVAG